MGQLGHLYWSAPQPLSAQEMRRQVLEEEQRKMEEERQRMIKMYREDRVQAAWLGMVEEDRRRGGPNSGPPGRAPEWFRENFRW